MVSTGVVVCPEELSFWRSGLLPGSGGKSPRSIAALFFIAQAASRIAASSAVGASGGQFFCRAVPVKLAVAPGIDSAADAVAPPATPVDALYAGAAGTALYAVDGYAPP